MTSLQDLVCCVAVVCYLIYRPAGTQRQTDLANPQPACFKGYTGKYPNLLAFIIGDLYNSWDTCIVPLDNHSYLGIYQIFEVGSHVIHAEYIACDINNGELTNNLSFPQLTGIQHPRNLFRVNDTCIVALSGVMGEITTFTAFNPDTQEYCTQYYQIDTDSADWWWHEYVAGDCFYLIRAVHVK